MDFFAGSGTTAAVALAMQRRFISVEQMDYINDVPVLRIKKAIDGECTNFHEKINWTGGGSFIYCELSKANDIYIDKINSVKTTDDLIEIWSEMQNKAFISYKLDIQKVNQHIDQFKMLDLIDQKRFLIEILDKNFMYTPYTEIEDSDYKFSDEEKKINHNFYGGKS